MTHAEQFVADVEAFLKRSGMSPTAFGVAVLKDPNFVTDLRTGRMPGLGLVDRVHDFINTKDAESQSEAAQ
jgi:hypothetical protein